MFAAILGLLIGGSLAERWQRRHYVRLLREANDAFDECTGPYPKSLVKGEPWRAYRDPSSHTDEEDRWDD